MQKFKIGDKVRLKKGLINGDKYGELEFFEYMGFNGTGIICEFSGVDMLLKSGDGYYYSPEMLEKVDCFQEGDIIVDEDGDERKILGVCGEVYFCSNCNPDCDIFSNGFTYSELIDNGYKLKSEKESNKDKKEAILKKIEELDEKKKELKAEVERL
jgi:hypothetical protein